jgi:O-antigen/teichoic acid export membrane protein
MSSTTSPSPRARSCAPASTDSPVIRGTVNNAVGTVLPAVAGLWAVPRIIDVIGLPLFGVFSLQVGVLFLLGLSDFGISRAVVLLAPDVRFARTGPGSAYAIGLRWSLLLGAAVACLAAPVGLGVLLLPARPDAADLALSTALMCLSAGVMLLSLAPRAALESQERFLASNLIRGPAAAAIFLGPLAAFAFSPSLTGAAGAILVTRIVAALFYFHAARPFPLARAGQEMVAREQRRALDRIFLAKAGWMGGANLLSLVITYVDRFVLAALGSAAGVALFVIAQEVVTKLWIVTGAAMAAAAPRLAADKHKEGVPEGRSSKQLTVIMLVAGALPAAVLVVWGEAILRTWLGSSFQAASVLPLQLMAAAVGLNSLSQVNFLLLQVRGGERSSMLLQVYNLGFLAVALPLLVPKYGADGAALAFALRLVADTFILRYLLDRTEQGAGVGVRLPLLAGTALFFAALVIVCSQDGGLGAGREGLPVEGQSSLSPR